MSAHYATAKTQRGTTLLEGLVAFLVLSLGMLSVVRVQTQLRLNSDVARQRSEAVRLAQEDLERMRAFSVIAARPGANAYASLTSTSATIDAASSVPSNTSYVLSRSISNADVPNSKNATVRVTWDDRTGTAQQVVLNTLISGSDPAYSGTLNLVPRSVAVRGVLARAASIALGAKDLGNGTSVFKPALNASEVLVLDNRSGAVTAQCSGIAPLASTANPRLSDLQGCVALNGQLLSGTIRFASTSPPDATQANAAPPGLAVALVLTGSPAGVGPSCTSEARKTVTYSLAGSTRIEAVPLSATPASIGVGAWQETGERYVAYHCVVITASPGAAWSGRSVIVPEGWTIGSGPNDRRVCRFSADLDRSGAVDSNLEHPDSYSGVGSSLANQNFLVISASDACPTRQTAGGGPYADLGTAAHQP